MDGAAKMKCFDIDVNVDCRFLSTHARLVKSPPPDLRRRNRKKPTLWNFGVFQRVFTHKWNRGSRSACPRLDGNFEVGRERHERFSLRVSQLRVLGSGNFDKRTHGPQPSEAVR